ncbi:hypothetical protein G7B40_018010 [Aetokthonos hydrillicola Thurmond2011]|jgi:RNA polymerase subunit RPABC4/transcription elongation factor Spt4/flagellar motility protein MotE (MotC chaperone)|uniref:Zinc ribbon domain-containing protein n=1 Tax=Aetokthonos hydrillicola Thurmond2011 TaxID=2712845 RepID=A0AAP5I815_9CYAN|nr:hypothetical protein [Aetokthonos hydrillicola]MBO3460401.1 hypothetical protein [Aetokthonos hydrillicola CCALA 1050]MBW4584477.1 hypothetical protein [Aetokthonos hydrillicola CCALA 1050]MDR9896440.1 hypothetical protein [Aetokthonos hydrillicola Thurmond2011]
MLTNIRRLFSQFFNSSRTINNEPLNKVSLIVIILIDIFILINVFTGLDDISRWYLSPSEAYPCYADWQNYKTETTKDKDYQIIKISLPYERDNQISQKQTYQQAAEKHLGKVSPTCLNYAEYKDKINNSENRQTVKSIDQKQTQISTLKKENSNIRSQYDSTLLEKIAGQTREQSINEVGAEKAKQELDENNRTITTLEKEIDNLKNGLVAKPESTNFIAFLKNEEKFSKVKQDYQRASFWYPSIQFGFQALFLLPLIVVALLVYKLAQRKGYGLILLMSWHLLVILFIPLIFKIFEFLQVGAIFQFLVEIIGKLLNGLLFLISYIYILLIPVIGFGIIKVCQKVIFNPKLQAVSRVQKSRCSKCAKKIRHNDAYCPYCGYYQYIECQNCHNLTYKNLPYCKTCGDVQDLTSRLP